MKLKSKNIINLIVGIVIILYVFLGTDFLNNVKEDTKKMQGSIKKEEKVKVDVNGNLKVYILDVGQADTILINNNDHYMLIDAGNNSDGKKLVNYFNKLGIKTFDYMFLTHPHEDHIGGADDVINNFEIRNFYMTDMMTTTKTFEDVLDALDRKNMTYSVPKIDEEIKFNDSNIKILYTNSSCSNNLNDCSTVIKLTYGNNSFLFTGDAPSEIENKIINKDVESDFLKVGHHGSNYSSSETFIKKVNPKYAAISVGDNNIYNHPSKTIIDRLNNNGIEFFQTNKNGSIIVTSDGEKLDISFEYTDTNG